MGAKYDEKIDVYSFGVILWELYEKVRPSSVLQGNFTGTSVATAGSLSSQPAKHKFAREPRNLTTESADKIATGQRPPLSSNMPPTYALLVQMCWSQSPAQRPPFEQVVARMESLSQELAVL